MAALGGSRPVSLHPDVMTSSTVRHLPLAAALASACLGVAACSNEIVIVDGSGSTGSPSSSSASSGAGGSGGEAPRTIDVVDVSGGDASAVLVLHNRADGTLVESWPGTALPVAPTVVDGDLFTFASEGYSGPHAYSYRIEKDVSRLEMRLGEADFGDCPTTTESMHVDVHLPAMPGATEAHVEGIYDHDETYTLPADLAIDVRACEGVGTSDVFIHVDSYDGYLGFEYHVLPFAPGTTVSLTPTFADQPRKPLVFAVDQTDGAKGGGGMAYWLRDDASPGLVTYEHGFDADFAGDAPFVYEANLIDVPHGRPFAAAWSSFEPPPGACEDWATILRAGESDTPIPFHVAELARPVADGASWSLGTAGKPADLVQRQWTKGKSGYVVWSLAEDPNFPRPAVFPTFPSNTVLSFPPGDLALESISHSDIEGPTSYAEVVGHAPPQPDLETMSRSRTVYYSCDP